MTKQSRRKKGNWTYGVPNLELDRTTVDGDHSGAELDANGEIMHRLEPLVRELQEQAWFSYTCTVPHQNPIVFITQFSIYNPQKWKIKYNKIRKLGISIIGTCVADDDVLEEIVVRHGSYAVVSRKKEEEDDSPRCLSLSLSLSL